MSKFPKPTAPFVESQTQGKRQRPSAIMIEASFTTSDKGAALGLANMLHTTHDPYVAGHYTIDSDSVYRCASDKKTVGIYKNLIRLVVCAEPITRDVFWDDSQHYKVLHRTAELVADLSLAYRIPNRYLDDKLEARWKKLPLWFFGGIIINVPGSWPKQAFLQDVDHYRLIKSAV